jgi:putative tributyrin esterase
MKIHFPLRLFVVAMFFVVPSLLYSQPVVRVDSFYMPSLGATKRLSILLPDGYTPQRRYAVLYLLHGFSGGNNDWLLRTKLKEYVAGMPLIVVMPDAGNSWYANAVSEPADRYEDYAAIDVPAYIHKLYSVDTTREAIAGLSMGGYGALMLGLKHPHRYAFSGSLSGAITFPRGMNDTTRDVEKPLFPSLRHAFGTMQSDARNGYDLFVLYKQVPKNELPYLYLVAGIQDHEVPGGHNWQFWDREIQNLLKRMREVMKF